MRKIIIKHRPRLNCWAVKQAGKVVFKGTEAECLAHRDALEEADLQRVLDACDAATAKLNAAVAALDAPSVGVTPEPAPMAFKMVKDSVNGGTHLIRTDTPPPSVGVTPKEQAVLQYCVWASGNGATTLEEMLQDNMTWFSCKDLVEGLKISKASAAGLMSSLEAKGLAMDAEKGAPVRYDRADWVLTTAGLNAVQWAEFAASPNDLTA